jgi:tRNA dimethylallyltransferase
MQIGTAAPGKEELEKVPHYLIGELDPDQDYTVFKFLDRTGKIISGAGEKKVIICGGTPLYIDSFLRGINDIPDQDPEYRKELNKKSSSELHALLQEKDFERAEKIHPNNRKRVIRSLEIIYLTGKKVTDLFAEQKSPSPDNYIYCVINWPREILYERINKRVDMMLENGFVKEVENLLKMGFLRELNSMKSIGYPQIISYLDRNISFEEAVREIKKNTRNFARKQLIWFRRQKHAIWIDRDKNTFEESVNILSEYFNPKIVT